MMHRRGFLRLAMAGVPLATLQAQRTGQAARAGGLPALTPLDYYDIEQLFSRYCHALDSANGPMFAGCFTPDGIFVNPTGTSSQGYERLAAVARPTPDGRRGPTNNQHLMANIFVEPAPWGATGRSYVLLAQAPPIGQPQSFINEGGQYWDDLVRTSDGWRIKRRVYVRRDSPLPALPPLEPAPLPEGPAPVRLLTLSADDLVAVDELYADYAEGLDSAAAQRSGWANLFTSDGVHVELGAAPESFKGRDQLAAFATGAGAPRGALSIAHIHTSLMLAPSAEGIVAKSFRLAGGVDEQGKVAFSSGGVYFDLLVRTPDRWRFKESWYLPPRGTVPAAAQRLVTPTGAPGAAAVAPRTTGSRLPAEDHVAIRQLVARSAAAFDAAVDGGRAYAELFTQDGRFVDAGGTAVAGRDRLAAMASSDPRSRKGIQNVEQFIWRVKVEKSPGGARAKAYVMVLNVDQPGKPAVILDGGQYWDDLVKTSSGWRIRQRTFHRLSR